LTDNPNRSASFIKEGALVSTGGAIDKDDQLASNALIGVKRSIDSHTGHIAESDVDGLDPKLVNPSAIDEEVKKDSSKRGNSS
jgi:hypothetical protein